MEEFFKSTVINLSKESKCSSRRVGCLIVKENRIISTGYNGTLPGVKNCSSIFSSSLDGHHSWSILNELHAEQNAIIMAAKNGISLNGCTCYTSLQPCNTCLLMLLQCGIKEIVYLESYERSNYSEEIVEFMKNNEVIFRRFI